VLICGIAGQDDAHMAEFLLGKGYEVSGTERDSATFNCAVIKRLGANDSVKFLLMALNYFRNVLQFITRVASDESRAFSKARQRCAPFEGQPKETKERLVKAENDPRSMQEKTDLAVLERQADALVKSAAQIRAMIAIREIQLAMMRDSGTERNPDVMRLASEFAALRSELARMESTQGSNPGSAVEMPVNKIPEAAVKYIRARCELKLQETILEETVRQFEAAKLDEAKEGPLLQQVDKAMPPDYESKPSRASIVLTGALLALFGSVAWVILRRYSGLKGEAQDGQSEAWVAAGQAWRWRS
jgi:hypothetical protein